MSASATGARPVSTLSEGLGTVLERGRLFAAREGASSPLFLRNLRRDGLETLDRLGLPRPSDEEWRYTSVATIAKRLPDLFRPDGAPDRVPAPAEGPSAVGASIASLGALGVDRRAHHQLVLVNGRFDAGLSRLDGLPAGVRFDALSRLFAEPPPLLEQRLGLLGGHRVHPFVAMNAAFLADGAFVHVPDGVALAEPLLVVHVADASAGPVSSHPRVVVSLGESAQAQVVEVFCGAGEAFVNPVTEIVLGPHARLDHATLQEEAPEAFHVGAAEAHLGPGARLFSRALSFGGRIARNETTVRIHGDGAGATLDGLFLARAEQQVDNHTLVDHARPHGGSQQSYKGILDGSARGAFDGRVVVRASAPFTDAHQKNRNLLLSDTARIDAKPQLEIYNNDVKCTHGSATGRLDADALFYLRSRAFSERDARSVLTLAFASEIVDRIPFEPLRAHLTGLVLGWLAGAGPEAR